jgi:hypothetical protein
MKDKILWNNYWQRNNLFLLWIGLATFLSIQTVSFYKQLRRKLYDSSNLVRTSKTKTRKRI